MTPSTSKPAKLLTSLWIRLSCGEARRGREGRPDDGERSMPGGIGNQKGGEVKKKIQKKNQLHTFVRDDDSTF